MKSNANPDLATPAWHFERMMFNRGKPGTLSLGDGRLTFVTSPTGSAESSWYEDDGHPDETLFDVPVMELEAISYNWLVATLTVREGSHRHIIGFAVQSGSHAKDAVALVKAFATLNRWRALLDEKALVS